MTKTNEEIGAEAAVFARKKVLREAKQVKLTVRKVLRRISEGLDAQETKTSYDKDRGKWVYSKDMVAHGVRLDAASLGVTVLDMKPCEKKKIDLSGNINLSNLTDEQLAEIAKGKLPKDLVK